MEIVLSSPVRLDDLASEIYRHMGLSQEPEIIPVLAHYKKECEGIDRRTAILYFGEPGFHPKLGGQRYFEISTLCHSTTLSDVPNATSDSFKVNPGYLYTSRVRNAVKIIVDNQPIPIQSIETVNSAKY